MDVFHTPPHSTSPLSHFGEAPFLWAPKISQKYRKPTLRSGRKTSSRKLDFSAIIVQDEDNDNSSFTNGFGRQEGQAHRRGSRHETPVFSSQNVDSSARVSGSPLAFENVIARRIDFASQSLTPGQGVTESSDSPSVFSPGLSPVARGILSQLRRSASGKSSAEKRTASKMSEQNTPESRSPVKRGKWTRLIR